MQRWLGIGFLALFAYALVGVYPAQWAIRCMARHEMQEYLRTHTASDLGVVSMTITLDHGMVNDPRFAWEEEGKEFRFDGALFDVICSTASATDIILQCVADGRETSVLHQARMLGDLNNPGCSTSTRGHIKCAVDLFLPMGVDMRSVADRPSHSTCSAPSMPLSSGYRGTASLPPWDRAALI